LHTRPLADALPPSGHVFEAGAVDQRFSPDIDRVETQIGDGDLAAAR
jgi:hypothetical protein